jgi:hypothetical protein
MNSPNWQEKNKSLFCFCIFSVVLLVSLTGIPRPAAAAALFDSLVPGTGINFYEDVDRDVIVDIDGSGSLTTGDVFIGFARIDDRSLPLPGIHFAPEEIYGVFSNTVTNDPIGERIDNGDGTFTYNISFGPTNMPGLDLGSLLGGIPVPAGSLIAIYEAVGVNLIVQSPGDFDEDGSFTVLDFIATIAAADLDVVAGFRDSDDHWVASFKNIPAVTDPISNLAVLEIATLGGGIPGQISFHAGLSILVNNHPTFSFSKNVEDKVEFPAITLHELTVQNGDVSGASDLVFPQGNPFFGELTVDATTYTVYGASTNADYGVVPVVEQAPGACRMTGGNATVFAITGTDGLDTWSYQFEGPSDGEQVTTGGTINAPSGNNPLSGHWEHTLHGGADGVFSFHAGTASAPAGTEISTVECADPGWCVQARCAPFKQLFWTGIGNFANQRFDYDFDSCNVVKGNRGTLHHVKVMIGDFGENNRPTREVPGNCDWFSKLPGGTVPGPWEAADAVLLDSVPDDQFGDNGGQVCNTCPDYYQIEIHCTTDPASDVIYSFAGFLGGGNYQIHPETGEKCPVVEALVPELFESTSGTDKGGKGKGKKK